MIVSILSIFIFLGNIGLAQQVLVGEKYVQTRTIQQYLMPDIDKESWNGTAFSWTSIQKDLIDKFGERYEKYTKI